MSIPNLDSIASAIQSIDLPPLLAAMADHYGDRRFIAAEFRPARPTVGAIVRADGGLSQSVQAAARDLVVTTLAAGEPSAKAESIDPQEILSFLTGERDSPFMRRIAREITGRSSNFQDEKLSGLTVAVIGGGVSGICASVKLMEQGADCTVFDRNDSLGGTWFANAYPGCRLDTSTFVYSFSFAQRTDWKYTYSPRSEVLRYVQEVADAHQVPERTIFNAEVVRLVWKEAEAKWSVTWKDSSSAEQSRLFDIVVSAVGQLNQPKIPAFAGIENFQGEIVHSATWPALTDVKDRRVAVVGSGASGFQIVPEIADQVESLTLFQRNAPWLLPEPRYENPTDGLQKTLLDNIPPYHRWYRFWQFWAAAEGRLPLSIVDPDWKNKGSVSELNENFRAELVEHLEKQFGDDPELLKKMMPDYPPGSKRLVRDSGRWAAALKRPNVNVESSPIDKLTESGIYTANGNNYEIDTLILATGFNADNYLAGIEVVGRENLKIREYWGSRPRAYLGITVPQFPNFFMLYGPNTNLAVNGSLLFMIECAVDYVIATLRTMTELNMHSVDTTEQALEGFVQLMDTANAERAWGIDSVSNWYKGATGVVTQNWPLSLASYWHLTQDLEEGAHQFN